MLTLIKSLRGRDNFFEGVPSPAGGILVLTPLVISMTNFDYIKLDYNIIAPIFFITTSYVLISKFPTYSFKKNSNSKKNNNIFIIWNSLIFWTTSYLSFHCNIY